MHTISGINSLLYCVFLSLYLRKIRTSVDQIYLKVTTNTKLCPFRDTVHYRHQNIYTYIAALLMTDQVWFSHTHTVTQTHYFYIPKTLVLNYKTVKTKPVLRCYTFSFTGPELLPKKPFATGFYRVITL